MSDDYEIGYGRPPKAGQFKKGRSGNPAGRPRRQQQSDLGSLLSGHLPVQAAIAAEGRRMVPIKTANGPQQISTLEVALRALTKEAGQGGILAIRTLIELQLQEAARQYKLRCENYANWSQYCATVRPLFAAAATAGLPPPAMYPHPDDVEFDYANLSVTIDGPMSAEGASLDQKLKRYSAFAFELSLYLGEDSYLDPQRMRDSKIGNWFMLHVSLERSLPKRLSAAFSTDDEQTWRIRGTRRRWKAHLLAECEALELPKIVMDLPLKELSWSDLTRILRKARRKCPS